ncbi:MAG: GNAT family N-acetyltransferase [Muribaculaceae bacterium]|nr:GNAT family N-acetyltransferase [Muribaculaceae bacterium]MDE6135471.1 GNAT family N-acetyltransferase [Muribaculaceae bacterium]
MDFKIRPAFCCDAPHIARAVMMAIGDEICSGLAGADRNLDDVRRLFTELAAMESSQYSYRNAIVAEDPEGNVAGVCVGYDGALLHSLRQSFIEKASEILGRDFIGMDDETDSGEFYLDTLAVLPCYRGQGLGGRLLLERADIGTKATGKRAGLLVDKVNPGAQRLYESLGFRYAGDRPFAGVMMNHMTL